MQFLQQSSNTLNFNADFRSYKSICHTRNHRNVKARKNKHPRLMKLMHYNDIMEIIVPNTDFEFVIIFILSYF